MHGPPGPNCGTALGLGAERGRHRWLGSRLPLPRLARCPVIIGHALLWGRPRPAPEDWPVEEEEEEGSSELDLVLIFLQVLWLNKPSEH